MHRVALAWALFFLGSWSVAQGPPRIQWVRGGHHNLFRIEYSQDGQALVTSGGGDGTIKLWRADTGAFLRTINAGRDNFALSPDGKNLATAYGAGTGIIRISDGSIVRVVGTDSPLDLAFSPDGGLVAVSNYGQFVRVWDVQTGQLRATLPGLNTSSFHVEFSPDGRYIAFVSWMWSYLRVFRTTDWTHVRDIEAASAGASHTYDFAFSPDSDSIVWGFSPSGLVLWRLSDGASLRRFAPAIDGEIKLSRDGEALIASGGTKLASWRFSDGFVWMVDDNYPSGYQGLAIQPDLQRIAVGITNPPRRLQMRTRAAHGPAFWNVAQEFLECRDPLELMDVSPDGTRVVHCRRGGYEIYVRNASDGGHHLLISPGVEVDSISVSDDSQTLMAGVASEIRVFSLQTGQLVRTYSATGDLEQVRHIPGSGLFASGGGWWSYSAGWHDCNIHIRRLSDGATLAVLGDHPTFIDSVIVSQDGRLIATKSEHEIRIWSLSTNRLITRIAGPFEFGTTPSFSRGGDLLAYPIGNLVKIVRTVDGRPVRTLLGHTGRVTSASFAPSGNVLCSGSWDGTIRVWRMSDGALVRLYDRETGAPAVGGGVRTLQFAPQGSSFYYGRYDATLVRALAPNP